MGVKKSVVSIASRESPVRLTELSHGAGCACKLSPADLRTVLGLVRAPGAPSDPNLLVGYDTAERALYVDRTASGDTDFHPGFGAVHRAPLGLDPGEPLALEIHIDSTSVEVYASGGRVVITDLVFPSPGSEGVALFAEGGTAHLHSLAITPVGQ